MQLHWGKLKGKRKRESDTPRYDQPDKSLKCAASLQKTTSVSDRSDTASTSGVAQLHCVTFADSNQCSTNSVVWSETASMETEQEATVESNAVASGMHQTPDNSPTTKLFSLPGFQECLNELNKNNASVTMAKFSETLDMYEGYQLFILIKFYRDRIEQAIEDDVEAISSLLSRKEYFSQEEHQNLTELTHSGRKTQSSKRLVNLALGKGSWECRVLWESFSEMRSTLPKLNKIMTEIQELGASLVNRLMIDHHVPKVPNNLEAIQRQHKEKLRKQTEKLEVNTILMKEKVKMFQLVDKYTELTMISDLRHRQLVEHELLATGRDHEKCRQEQLRGKLEKIRTDKLFNSSFSSGGSRRIIHSRIRKTNKRSSPDSPTGTSAVVSGVAGIGKTTMVQKIVHEWAKGKIYPYFHFVFVFKFRDLNRLHTKTSLSQLIVQEYPYLKDVLDELWIHPERLLFIFDGLDEFRTRIDFADNQRDTDPQRECTNPEFLCDVSDVVYSLIQKKLLSGCSVLVTSRRTALQLLAEAQVSVWAEILGFVGEERREYFLKIFEDQAVAAAVYSHVEENELLLTMCYNPSYCWILALSLGPFFTGQLSKKQQVPKTITQLFSYYIYHILANHSVKTQCPRDVMLKIGEMAFNGVSQRNIVFNNEDLIKSKLEPSQFLSGFLMELVEREDSEHSVVYTFPHLTVQEFVAALAKFLPPNPGNLRKILNEAHRGMDGFEIFLRFVAGLCSPRAAEPLEELLGPFVHQTTCAVIDWLKEKVKAQIKHTDTVNGKRKLLNTLHYLFESQDQALARVTLGSVQPLTLGGCSPDKALRLTPMDCVVLSQVTGMCDTINLLDLSHCYIQDEGLQRLIHVLHKFLNLQLGGNNLGDSGIKSLCEALRKPECKIQKLELWNNNLTTDCTEDLVTALCTNSSLTQLELGNNKLRDGGVKRLFEALGNPECKMRKLWLNSNSLTDGCTDDLVSALSRNRSLRELYLESNFFTDASVPALRHHKMTCTSLVDIRNQFSSEGLRQLESLCKSRAELRANERRMQ